jgi:hypothetical protein
MYPDFEEPCSQRSGSPAHGPNRFLLERLGLHHLLNLAREFAQVKSACQKLENEEFLRNGKVMKGE